MNILLVPGSLRKNSFNRQLARYVERMIGERATVDYLEWGDIPVFNEDDEFPAPAPVERIRSQVRAADGIWFFTPEYNLFIPGGLKNVTDWISRSLEQGNTRGQSAIHQKKTTVSAVAATGGDDVATQFEILLGFIRTDVLSHEGRGVKIAPESWESDTLVLSSEDEAKIAGHVDAFLEFVAQ